MSPLMADIVAKRVFASRRATLIQKIDPPRNIDSSGAPVGFESCALGGGRGLLQQNLPKADIPTARFRRDPESLLAGHRVILLSDRLTTNQFGIVRNRQRPTRQITLHLIATLLHKERMLGFGLDSFREDRQIKASAETDDCTHDCLGVVVGFQVANKDTIDLDLVKFEGLQIRQGRISGSEIVHCNPHAKRLEATQDRYRAREVVNHNALGDFEFEAARSKTGFEQNRMDEPRQVAVAELHRRDIDRNGQRLRPGCGFVTSLTQDPFAYRDDETALLSNGNKRGGWDHAAFWTLPAGQRFKPDGFARHFLLRLIVQEQFATING